MEYPKESVGEVKAQIEAGLAANQELETENQKLQAKVSEFEAKNQELETENQKLREEKALALTQAEVEYRLRCEAFHEGVALGRQGQAGSTPKPLRVTSDMLEEPPNDRIENHCVDARRFPHTHASMDVEGTLLVWGSRGHWGADARRFPAHASIDVEGINGISTLLVWGSRVRQNLMGSE